MFSTLIRNVSWAAEYAEEIMLKIQLCIKEIRYVLLDIKIKKYILNCSNIYSITC